MRPLASILATLLILLFAAPSPAQYGDISGIKLNKPEDKEDTKSTPAPEGAVVLFDGKSLDGWLQTDGKTKAQWKLVDLAVSQRVMQVEKGAGNIISAKKFDGDFKLHVEFRVPYMPEARGQGRGNSGVYVQGRYEVQVLDSYGLESKNDDCGAIYFFAAPRVNACKAPTVWQSYDIEYHSPKCENGKKVELGRMTVYQNGVKIHDNVKLTEDNTQGGLDGDACTGGQLMLQDHKDPVQFRNIWVLPLK